MGPLILSMVAGVAAATAEHIFKSAGGKNSPGSSSAETKKEIKQMGQYDDEIGADEIYVETGADDEVGDDEVGARKRARSRPRTSPAGGRPAYRRIAFITAVAIAAAATTQVAITLNHPFKGVGMRLSGTNQDKLLYNGTVIRGTPQEASSGSVGCEIFTHPGETYFWEWDTANPGESFTLSFTNTHTAAVTPTGYLVGYLS
jgi:hypothetical protein